MITWLPYPDFIESVGALDKPTLVDTRMSALTILNVLHQIGPPVPEVWAAHPAVRMWKNHEVSLAEYGLLSCEESLARRSTDGNQGLLLFEQHMDWATSGKFTMEKPSWFGDHEFHLSHQSNLIRHNPEVYTPKFPGVANDLPYIWPQP